jgi:hypothetical protein
LQHPTAHARANVIDDRLQRGAIGTGKARTLRVERHELRLQASSGIRS